MAKSAGREAHRARDLTRDLHVGGRAEVDVEGDEEGTRADRGCARGWMDLRVTEVGLPRRVRGDLVTQALELAAADIGEVDAIGTGGGALVQVDRDPQLLRGPLA